MKKKIIYLLLLAIFFIPSVVNAENLTESVDKSKKIYDFGEILTDEEEKEIYLLEDKYIKENSLDLVVVTLKDNPYGDTKESTISYANDFYTNNGFNEDGVILLIDKKTGINYLKSFGRGENIYDSTKINSINNSISTFVDKNNYYQTIKVYITKLDNYKNGDELICNDENDNKYKCKTPKVDNSKKVYDYADLLTDEQEKNLFNSVKDFINRYDMDVAIVTINDNPYGVSDYYSKIYAQDFYYYNQFGIGSSHDGFILLIDMSNRYVYMATKGKAILVYDDDRIDTITGVAYNYLKDGKYYEGYRSMLNKASVFAAKGIAKSNEYYCVDEKGEPYKCKEKPKIVNWGLSLIIGLLGSLIPAFIHTRKYRGIKLATNANTYLKNTNIDNKIDQFLTTFTSRVRRSHDSSSGGGHFGGSSISHGSGGSFGGGGRHF